LRRQATRSAFVAIEDLPAAAGIAFADLVDVEVASALDDDRRRYHELLEAMRRKRFRAVSRTDDGRSLGRSSCEP
jgi:hypothetical protein